MMMTMTTTMMAHSSGDDQKFHSTKTIYDDGADEQQYDSDGTEINWFDDSYYECWMNEWLDDDGEIMMSDGYEMDECEEALMMTMTTTTMEMTILQFMMDVLGNVMNTKL